MINYEKQVYNAFHNYIQLKLHFKGQVDYRKTPLKHFKPEVLWKRKDKDLFGLFVTRYKDEQERYELLVSGFVFDKDYYIGNLLDMTEEFKEFHYNRLTVIKSLNYYVGKDLQYLTDCGIIIENAMKVDEKPYPSIVRMDINLETLALIDKVFHFTKQSSLSPLWDKQRLMIGQYGKLLEFDTSIIKNTLKPLDSKP